MKQKIKRVIELALVFGAGMNLGSTLYAVKSVLVDKRELKREGNHFYWQMVKQEEPEEHVFWKYDKEEEEKIQEHVDKELKEIRKNREEMDPLLNNMFANGGVLDPELVEKMKPNKVVNYPKAINIANNKKNAQQLNAGETIKEDTYYVSEEEVDDFGNVRYIPNKTAEPDDAYIIDDNYHEGNRPENFQEDCIEWVCTGDQEIISYPYPGSDTPWILQTERYISNDVFNELFRMWNDGEVNENSEVYIRVPVLLADVVITFDERSSEELNAVPEDEC